MCCPRNLSGASYDLITIYDFVTFSGFSGRTGAHIASMTLIIVLSLPSRCAIFFFLVFIFIIALDAFMHQVQRRSFAVDPAG